MLNSRILITGGTGSWGQTLTKVLLEKYAPKEIIIFSRGELAQVLMQRKFNDNRIKYVIGDVRDYEALYRATKNIDYIFHLAALKHVPVCENYPQEAIKTNVEGTNNIVNAAIINEVKKVIDVSTDKAVDPINTYGITKALGEKIIINANKLSDLTKFVCIRGGNVMGSNGSVIPLFIDQLKNAPAISITDLKMTRFFLTLNEAIYLLLKAAFNSFGEEIFVMNMPSCYIKDIAFVLMEKYGKKQIIEIGIRPGEKLNEILISENESKLTYEYGKNYWVILPIDTSEKLFNHYKNNNKFPFNKFSSEKNIINNNEIKKMLVKGNFL